MENLVITIFGGYNTWAFALTFILGFIIGGVVIHLKWWLFPIPAFCIVLGYGYLTHQITTTSFTDEWVKSTASIAPFLWVVMSGLAVYISTSTSWDRMHNKTKAEK